MSDANHPVEETSARLFAPYRRRWNLTTDGDVIVTPRAHLLPVRYQGAPAMLKIATEPEEAFGGRLLGWWNGDGAARLLAAEGDAILMERATGSRSLLAYAREGRDDEATAILCDAILRLHAPRANPPPDLVPLDTWFAALAPAAARHGGFLGIALTEAERLLRAQREVRPLHGDIHHDNVLDFGPRGWLAIDPKRLTGDRAFDYANLFCNPDMDHPGWGIATDPARFARRLAIVAERAGLDRDRLLR